MDERARERKREGHGIFSQYNKYIYRIYYHYDRTMGVRTPESTKRTSVPIIINIVRSYRIPTVAADGNRGIRGPLDLYGSIRLIPRVVDGPKSLRLPDISVSVESLKRRKKYIK